MMRSAARGHAPALVGRAAAASALLLLALAPLACGYHLSGTQVDVPGDIHSISVGHFDNLSHQEGLEKMLAFAFEREFYERGTLRLRENPSEGDGIITGTIREFKTRPVSFDANEEALQYEAELTLDVTLRRQADGKMLWKGSRLHAFEEYSVSRQTVVPSSSQFQQGTLDFANLAQLSDVQLAETEKRLAIERMVRAIVRDVHDRILDDF
jgi:Lipopolysaccharide-assembly